MSKVSSSTCFANNAERMSVATDIPSNKTLPECQGHHVGKQAWQAWQSK